MFHFCAKCGDSRDTDLAARYVLIKTHNNIMSEYSGL